MPHIFCNSRGLLKEALLHTHAAVLLPDQQEPKEKRGHLENGATKKTPTGINFILNIFRGYLNDCFKNTVDHDVLHNRVLTYIVCCL